MADAGLPPGVFTLLSVEQWLEVLTRFHLVPNCSQSRTRLTLATFIEGQSDSIRAQLLQAVENILRLPMASHGHVGPPSDLATTAGLPAGTFGRLSRPQWLAILHAAGFEPNPVQARTKQGLGMFIGHLPLDQRSRVLQAAISFVPSRKRPSIPEDSMPPPAKRPRLDIISDLIDGPFLRIVPEATIRDSVRAYVHATSNSALQRAVCIVCGRILTMDRLQHTLVAALPSPHLLRPLEPHPAHTLFHDLLLYSPAIKNDGGHACSTCLKQLKAGVRPKLSLANNMWLGDVPFALDILTLCERVLIARYFPAAYVVKLWPQDKALRLDPQCVNSGMRGNVSTFPFDTQSISDLMAGNLMPQLPQVLAATIAVTVIGARGRPERTLPREFFVRRQRVHDALLWLKTNNSVYADIIIDNFRLAALPENGIPQALIDVVRESDDVEALLQEHDSYVPNGSDDDDEMTFLDLDCEMEASQGDQRPAVIPLQGVGVINTQAQDVSESSLIATALNNTAQQGETESQRFGVRYGLPHVNEYARRDEQGRLTTGGHERPNHLLGAFPFLFPYGVGGVEVPRERDVSYEEHIRWALQYADKRFRKDGQFMFQAFGIILKRNIARQAKVQVDFSTYKHYEAQIRALTPADLRQASYEEANQLPFSNPAVKILRSQLSAVRTRVEGTDEHRRFVRAQIWGCTVVHGPPSLWITINPSDIHDPIAQIFCGENIDLDRFDERAGPDAYERSVNIASDPYAAADFFHTTIQLMLTHLFGISGGGKGRIKRRDGIFGTVQAYIGTVEAQGRGTLYLHMLLWLQGAPTAETMASALQREEFRDKVRSWIRQNIHAHIPGLTVADIDRLPHTSACSYSRPVDPNRPDYLSEVNKRVKLLARSLQFHRCKVGGCLVVYRHRFQCKRRAPFVTSDAEWITSAGEWGPQRLHPYMVGWQPSLLHCLRCNHDVKFLPNTGETLKLPWYMTSYATKKRNKTTNVSALLAKRLAYHTVQETKSKKELERNQRLIQRCANTLTRDQEFSGPEVISYMMGWGDRFISHTFATIHWWSVARKLKASFPGLNQLSSDHAITTFHQERPEDTSCTLSFRDGEISFHDQVKDYVKRPERFSQFNYLDYFLNTYERRVVTGHQKTMARGVCYLDGYRSGYERVERLPGHDTLPHFVGPWFPRRDEPQPSAFYCASMLALFKPWRSFNDLLEGVQSWEEAFDHLLMDTPESLKHLMDNINFYYRSQEAASQDIDALSSGPIAVPTPEFDDGFDPILEHGATLEVTEADIEQARLKAESDRVKKFAQDGMDIAFLNGIFSEEGTQSAWLEVAPRALSSESKLYEQWAETIERHVCTEGDSFATIEFGTDTQPPTVVATSTLGATSSAPVAHKTLPTIVDLTPSPPTMPTIDSLNPDQTRAHNIVVNHMRATLRGESPKQLLLIVSGSGGTGKSTVIEAITKSFAAEGTSAWLAKTATSGVAASRIGGCTLHSWVGIGPKSTLASVCKTSNRAMIARRRKNIGTTKYLIVDEFSMMTKELLAKTSKVCCHVKCELGVCDMKDFGGVNIILMGDFHQLPPVCSNNGVLYSPNNITDEQSLGQEIFRHFQECVILCQQMRVRDCEWDSMLQRLREGACTDDDIVMLQSLVVKPNNPLNPDFTTAPWNDCILITSRHGLRRRWNEAAIRRHSAQTGNLIYISTAEDVAEVDRPLNPEERLIMASKVDKESNKLEEAVEICVGMRAMVVMNISTDSDLSNGTRGRVSGIVLDPREPPVAVNGGVARLKYPPTCVLFRPESGRVPRFEGLEQGVIPIFPSRTKISITLRSGKKTTITRRQLALTPAYAFTDYKSQGQTIEFVMVDLGEDHHRALSPFNAYVALSRSRGRGTIRLLRTFDKQLVTTLPSTDLQAMDKLMHGYDINTKQRYLGAHMSA